MKGHLLINEDGAAIVIIFLILLPLLLITNVYYNENERLSTGSNVTLKNNVALAAKAAAQSVDSISQANGKPMINPAKAHENFKRMLMKILRLDSNMDPISGSPISDRVDYYLLVCNGENPFGLAEGIIYKYENGSIQTFTTLAACRRIHVNNNFSVNSDGKNVTLDAPGVIATVKVHKTRGNVRPNRDDKVGIGKDNSSLCGTKGRRQRS